MPFAEEPGEPEVPQGRGDVERGRGVGRVLERELERGPEVPVLAVSPRPETVRRLNLLFGVRCVQSPTRDDFRELLRELDAAPGRP